MGASGDAWRGTRGSVSIELTNLVELHYSAIRSAIKGTCTHWRVNGADADDLAMDLWVYLLRDDGRVLRRFRCCSKMGTYLFTVLNRAAAKWVRRQARRARVELQWCAREVGAIDETSQAAIAALPQGDELPNVEQVLSMLPERERTLLALRCDGLSNAEIGKLHGMSSNAVDLRIRRAIVRLRSAVGVRETCGQVSKPAGLGRKGSSIGTDVRIRSAHRGGPKERA